MNSNLKNICKVGQGSDCCKYLLCDREGFQCAKTGGLKDFVDQNWDSEKVAQGDNCSGLKKEELNEK
jgi:hypothetical protein